MEPRSDSASPRQRLARRLDARASRLNQSYRDDRQVGSTGKLPTHCSERRRHDLENAPADWRRWYRLAVAYDVAGDRRRARAAMRTAIARESP